MAAANDTEDFSFTFTHTDMANAPTTVYKLGDYIKFTMASNTARNEVKAIIQRCWTTTDGSANTYELITNRCVMEPGTSWFSAPTEKQSMLNVLSVSAWTLKTHRNVHSVHSLEERDVAPKKNHQPLDKWPSSNHQFSTSLTKNPQLKDLKDHQEF